MHAEQLKDALHEVFDSIFAMATDGAKEMHETRTRLIAVETEMAMMKATMKTMAGIVEKAKDDIVREMVEAREDVNDEMMKRVVNLENTVNGLMEWATSLRIAYE